MEKEIKHVHFQLTRNCNLRCSFCGQWGKKGFFADSIGEEMTFENWINVIHQLEEYRDKSGISPVVTLWGGEPLVCEFFDEIVKLLKEKAFTIEIITNGVFIDRHIGVIEKLVDRIYISVDGPRDIHDQIRGQGVYDRVIENIKSLNHPDIVVMSVITSELKAQLPEFFTELDGLGIKELYLQDMIGLSKSEIAGYKDWMKQVFDIDAKYIDSWENDWLFTECAIETEDFGYKIVRMAHKDTGICTSPFSHMHITWCGDVMYCTDFYDFSAGNVKKEGICEIFHNEKSELFRREIENGRCATCNHCSWRIS